MAIVMKSVKLRPATATVKQLRRCLHASAPRQGSPLFALAALSNSRETQHLSKLSKLSRVEHSPNLQLIKSSEVEPFAPPLPVQQPAKTGERRTQSAGAELVKGVSINKEATDLLSVGRAILAEKDATIKKLQRALDEQIEIAEKRKIAYSIYRADSRARIYRLKQNVQSARVWKWFLIVMGLSYGAWTYLSEPAQEMVAASRTASNSPVADVKRVAVSKASDSRTAVNADPHSSASSIATSPRAKASNATSSVMPPRKDVVKAETKIEPVQRSWPSIFWSK